MVLLLPSMEGDNNIVVLIDGRGTSGEAVLKLVKIVKTQKKEY